MAILHTLQIFVDTGRINWLLLLVLLKGRQVGLVLVPGLGLIALDGDMADPALISFSYIDRGFGVVHREGVHWLLLWLALGLIFLPLY